MPPARDDRAGLVLLIENDPSVRDLCRTALAGAGGFDVIPARDDVDALRRLALSAPDAVVVNLASTRDNGRSLIAALELRKLQQVPVVAISEEPIATVDGLAFACVLPKPVDLDDLVAAILHCLEARRRPVVGAGAVPAGVPSDVRGEKP